MKSGKRKISVLLALTVLFATALPYMDTLAGRNETKLTSESLTDTNWSNVEEDIIVDNGVIEFPETSTEYTRYISKGTAKKAEGFKQLVQLSSTIKFEKMPTGKKFVLAFALSSIEAITGEPGNIEVSFSNNNGIKVEVVTYDEDGQAVTLASSKSCGVSLNSLVKVNVTIGADDKMQVSVNGRTIHSVELPKSGEGRVGFLQTGECKVKVSNLEITHYQYDRPENSNVFEDFENGDMNASLLTAKMLGYYESFPMGQKIEDYNGNKVLMFRNTNRAYVGTTQQYSNFEITFDVPYMLTENIFADGALAKRKQGQIMVTFGGEQADWTTKGWEFAADSVVYTDYGVIASNNDLQNTKAKLTKDPFAEKGRPFSAKVTVVDGVVTAGIKWMEEKNYDTVLTYKLKGGMPMGYVSIWLSGAGYMAIDNIKVTNLDESPNLVETEATSGKFIRPADWDYKPMERKYKSDEFIVTEGSKIWYLLIPTSITLGGAAVIASYVISSRKKKEKKEETVIEIK